MGRILFCLVVVFSLTFSVNARIYESLKKQTKRYGTPLEVNISDFKNFGNKVFHVDPYLIAVNLQTVKSLSPWKKYEIAGPFRVNSIIYAKPIVLQRQKNYYEAYFSADNAGNNNKKLSEEDLEVILNANDPEREGWTSLDDTDDAQTWCRNDMKYYALYDKKQKTVRIFLDVLWKKWLSKDKIRRL